MVAASLLKLTAKQLFKNKKLNENFIRISERTDKTKNPSYTFIVDVPKLSVKELRIGTTLEGALKIRRDAINKAFKGYSPKEKASLLTENSNYYQYIDKQKAVDVLASKFKKDDPKTWKGLIDVFGDKVITPKNKKVENFILKKIKEVRGTPHKGSVSPDFDKTKTTNYILGQFANTKNARRLQQAPSQAKPGTKSFLQTFLDTKGIKTIKHKSPKSGRKTTDEVKALLNRRYYTPGQKRYMVELNAVKSWINKKAGINVIKGRGRLQEALEVEHADSVIAVLNKLGIKEHGKWLKNATDEQIKEVGDMAFKYQNLQFATKTQNLAKKELIEQVNSPKNLETRYNKWQALEQAGKEESEEAVKLWQGMKKDWDEFVNFRNIEAEQGMPLAYDFTEYTWLPSFARKKNPYKILTKNIGERALEIATARGLILPNYTRRFGGYKVNPAKFAGREHTEKAFASLEDGGRVEYADGPGPEGVQPIKDPTQEFDIDVKNMMETTGLDIGDSVLEVMKDRAMRSKYKMGGMVGDVKLGPSMSSQLDATNKVGAAESLLAGIGAGLLDIPKGAFTLGASLLDLGAGTHNAAKVEDWFDNLNDWDDKAEQHWLGTFSRIAVNLGVPGAYGWKAGQKLAQRALLSKRNGNYFRLNDPELAKRFNTALNGKGRFYATLGAAGGAGVSDAIFAGDVEDIGTFGDMVGGGPTQLEPNDANIASREIINRMKFGLDGSLFLGLIGGTGSAIKSLYRRRNDLSSNNDKIDKFFAAFRPRGRKSQAYFDMERRNLGARAGDINFASEQARKLDKHIDAIFPFVKNPFNKLGNKGRAEFMDDLNETLLSGDITMNPIGKVDFGSMDKKLIDKVTGTMKSKGAKKADIDGVFDSFEQMRLGWGHIFSRLGYSMDDSVRKEFAPLFGKKMKDYLGSTYEMFQNKSLIPLMNYAPTEEVVEKTIKIFQQSAKEAGKPISREQAEFYANQVVETVKPARDLATSAEKTSGVYFNAPDFFVNKTTLSELEGAKATVALDDLIPEVRGIFDELFGKVKDPMQTMLTGTNRLSLIGRRNQFYNDLLKSDEALAAERAEFLKTNPGGTIPGTMRGFFRETEREAVSDFGKNIKKIEIDPSRTIEAGITHPLNGKYAERGVAEAIEESSMVARDKSTLQQMYDSFVLYPKATSQMAKTILSPVTHVRNFVSAGAFASSNGLFLQAPSEIAKAMKDAYKALQIPGSRMANEEYRKLLRLGVVNSNVRLGDLTKLLKDTNFGESVNSRAALRNLMRPLSKAKKWTEDMYTAEDDFWKITSYALERQQLQKAYSKYGIKRTIDELDEEAADLIRNQIPNYDMVNDFIRATRKLPLGNFVSFPAEIMRTTANILQRALKEIKMTHTLDDGRIVHPLRGIGMKRAFGLGTTVVAIPYGTVEAAKAIYDVSEDEMKALRRFVPDWSKNSTLVPIRAEDGSLKYIDFSHANAYDTMIRPITALYTGIQRGMDEGEIGQEVMKGMWEGTKETLSPFVSESIWTTAISDIFLRQGRTREGNRLWTEETPWGERMNKAVMHALKTQFPGSIETFKRMDLAIEPVDIIMKGKYDKYGQSFELGDELLGFAGMRAVKVDPIRAMKFKIADFRTGINNARREFTSPLLRGGPVTPEQVIDRYKVASDALYKVQEKMFRDYYGARTLGVGIDELDAEFGDRVSAVQLNSIKRGEFKPFIPSENIEKAFRDNAREIGDPDPYRRARRMIRRLIKMYDGMPLGLRLPDLDNPFRTSGVDLPIVNSPILQGITNSPVTPPLVEITPQSQQIQQTAAAGQQVFGPNDSIFGAG